MRKVGGNMKNQVHGKNYEICGAKTRRRGTPCLRPAGWGTNHPGTGRCKLHGGCSTGPKDQRGNKNAVKTGEYETIWFDTLEEEEKELFYQINLDKIKQLENEIKLTEIRERRMLKRIQKLKEKDFIVTSHKEGVERGKVTSLEERQETLSQIQAIEEALTRVQAHKAKLIDLKHKLELDMGITTNDNEGIKEFINATRPSISELEELFEDDEYEET